MIDTPPTTTALASWFGSNRMLAEHVGRALDGCTWVGVPFAGSMTELIHIKARSLVVCDMHRHVINLASVVADPLDGPKLYRALRRVPFHPGVLAGAQERCKHPSNAWHTTIERFQWAFDYFITAWMGRSGIAGTDGEFNGKISARWNANGGDSATRFQSAVRSLPAWRRILRRANFQVMDAFDFLDTVKDEPGHGLYCDPPFPGPGDGYRHKFNASEHLRLAERLAAFGPMRIVCRFYDTPTIRALYPEPVWEWRLLEGRKQTNDAAPEVLLVKGGA